MAGIGFKLRKLVREDNLSGVVSAYTHAALVSTGPWIFTILAIGGITAFAGEAFSFREYVNFHVILAYNFAFTLIFNSPIAMIATRYLADAIFNKNVTKTPGMLVGTLLFSLTIQAPIAAFFYFFVFDLSAGMALIAFANYILVAILWHLAVFLTALKDYMSITVAFLIGMIAAFVVAVWLKADYGEAGMLLGFTIGLALICFLTLAEILAEYNYRLADLFDFAGYVRKYWDIALGGLLYAGAIWIDKIIMCFAPQAEILPSGMRIYFDYGQALFLAYLVIIPAMAMFVLIVETDFFERYHAFYRNILNHVPLARIRKDHENIMTSILTSARTIIIIQGVICFIAIVLAHKLFDVLNVNFIQIAMYRFGVLGAFFHVLSLFGIILLNYFEHRKAALWIQLFFVLTNGIFTLVTIFMGMPYYGYGYFLSSLLTFFLVGWVLFSYVKRLPYHAFITSNTSLKQKSPEAVQLQG